MSARIKLEIETSERLYSTIINVESNLNSDSIIDEIIDALYQIREIEVKSYVTLIDEEFNETF